MSFVQTANRNCRLALTCSHHVQQQRKIEQLRILLQNEQTWANFYPRVNNYANCHSIENNLEPWGGKQCLTHHGQNSWGLVEDIDAQSTPRFIRYCIFQQQNVVGFFLGRTKKCCPEWGLSVLPSRHPSGTDSQIQLHCLIGPQQEALRVWQSRVISSHWMSAASKCGWWLRLNVNRQSQIQIPHITSVMQLRRRVLCGAAIVRGAW